MGHRLIRRLSSATTYSQKVLSYNPIAYWPLWEPSGSVAACLINSAQNGSYTGVTLGQAGIGDGKTCPLFDGINDNCDIYSTTFRSAFDGAEGSVVLWEKVSGSGVWTDSTNRYGVLLRVNSDSQVVLFRNSANNRISFTYKAGGTVKNVDLNGLSTLSWMALGLTWSATADQVVAYYGGVQTGSTQTGLGTWAGNLADGFTLIGSGSGGSYWDGYLAHFQVYGTALSPAAMLDLASV